MPKDSSKKTAKNSNLPRMPDAVLLLIRIVVGIGAIVAGILGHCYEYGWSDTNMPWVLVIFGAAVLLHLSIDVLVFCLVIRVKYRQTSPNTFALETQRQIVDWLIVTSGVVIGLGIGNGVSSITMTVKAGFIALGSCIFVGLVYTGILAGGASSDSHGQVSVDEPHSTLLMILLNLLFMLFIFGMLGVLASFFCES